MGDTIDHDAVDGVVDCIEHAVATDAETVGVLGALELFSLRRPRVVRESLNGFLDR